MGNLIKTVAVLAAIKVVTHVIAKQCFETKAPNQ